MIVEVKSMESLINIHLALVLTYLKLNNSGLRLLITLMWKIKCWNQMSRYRVLICVLVEKLP